MYIKESDKFRLLDSESDHVYKNVEPGLYNIEIETTFFGKNIYFKKNDNYKNNKVIKTGIFKHACDVVDDHFSNEGKEIRKEMGAASRLGMLFAGEPGTGKTFLACSIAEDLVKKENAICILTSKMADINFKDLVDTMRKGNDPNQLIVFVLDEFEKDYGRCDKESLLGFLDGTDSRDNIVVLATANYISKLPSTLLNRPGRFEQVINFKIDDPDVLKLIISNIIPSKYKDKLDSEIVFNIVNNIKGITIDKVSKIIRDCLVNILKNKPLNNVSNRLVNNEAYKDSEATKKKRDCKIDIETLVDDLDELIEEEVYSINESKLKNIIERNKTRGEKLKEQVQEDSDYEEIDCD